MSNICSGGKSLIFGGDDEAVFMPLGGQAEAEWPTALKVVLYLLGLLWTFAGMSIVTERYMEATEVITRKKIVKKVKDKDGNMKDVTFKVWNNVLVNLTLDALGSSMPEIFLSVVELTLADQWHSGDLGPSTIVGSAAFNLLVIIAICISVLPEGEYRRIGDLKVFGVTTFFAIFAYVWLFMILVVITPDVVTIWEGVVTCLLYPALVTLAFMADKGYFTSSGDKLRLKPGRTTSEEYEKMLSALKDKYGSLPEDPADQQALVYHHFGPYATRAQHRVQAVSLMSGGSKMFNRPMVMRGLQVAERLRSKGDPAPEATVKFSSSSYIFKETDTSLNVTVEIERENDHKGPVSIVYMTRDGTAVAGKDYTKVKKMLTFSADETTQDIPLNIPKYKSGGTKEFYLDLKGARGATLGNVTTASIVVLDSQQNGVLSFQVESLKIEQKMDKQTMHLVVQRNNGTTGKVSCNWRTEDGTAKAGYDYVIGSGTLEFHAGVSAAVLSVDILPKGKYERNEMFRIYIEEATGGATFDLGKDGGKDNCNICTVSILDPEDLRRAHVDAILAGINYDEIQIGHENWKDQFKEALYIGGSREAQQSAVWYDWPCHMVNLPWKLLTAFIPPTDFCGGWLTFSASLAVGFLLTCVVSDLAHLLGCSLDIKAEICAVTLVTLGTSVPDIVEAVLEARQDARADSCIGNITGSMAINVFLGLGPSWTIGAVYWYLMGRTAQWDERGMEKGWLLELPHIVQDHPNGAFVVSGRNLGASVSVFLICAVFCLALLVLRRNFCKGELGGGKALAWASSAFLVILWLAYLCIAASIEGITPY